jgi:hypothetical protein
MKNLFKRKKRFERDVIGRQISTACSPLKRWFVNVFNRMSGELRRRAMIAKMQKADIILASPRTLRLSPVALMYRVLLLAQYVHSMLYIGEGKILHTTTKYGVVITPVPRKIFKKDRYTILRAKSLRAKQRQQVVTEALKLRDKRLDYAGLLTNVPARLFGLRKPFVMLEKNRLWCSKLIYQAYFASGIELVGPKHKENITSEDLSHSPLLEKI